MTSTVIGVLRVLGNTNLSAAKSVKNDEFYTQWPDIEREMNAYLEYNPNVFRDKVVLLPCDDPEWSNFTKYFALHFTNLGLKKLISTSYAPDSNYLGEFYAPTLFELDDPKYNEMKSKANGKLYVLERHDINNDGVINIDDLQWDYLEGDGDFQSSEVRKLRDEADIIITNPPFSLFRTFMDWLFESGKLFAVIGNNNAVTYKEIFPMIRDNHIWQGATGHSNDMVFEVPEGTEVSVSDREKAAKLGYEGSYTRLGNSCWFTNIDHGRRHEPLQLMTIADNIKYSRRKNVRGVGYARYDNFNAIEVPYVEAIPSDYDGAMGVPKSFLDKYNPDQFEILGTSQGWDVESGLKTKMYPTQVQVSKNGKRSNVGKLNDGGAISVSEVPDSTYYIVDDVMYVVPFARIFIQRRSQ